MADTLTYYGYEQPHTPDWDYNSWMGWGDRNHNDLTAGYSAALSVAARKQLLGVDSTTSTGSQFTYQGKTYRDDDTSPQSFVNVDVYSPGGVPGSATYDPSIVTPLGKSSGQTLAGDTLSSSSSESHQAALQTLQEPMSEDATSSQSKEGDSLLSGFKKAFPEHANVDFTKLMEKVAAIHPHIEPARIEELWTKATTFEQLANEQKTAKANYDKSFATLKQFYEGDSDGGSGSDSSSS